MNTALKPFATFNGIQRCDGIMPDFELWTLTAPIPGLCVGSTYAEQTLVAALERPTFADRCAQACCVAVVLAVTFLALSL